MNMSRIGTMRFKKIKQLVPKISTHNQVEIWLKILNIEENQ